VARAYELHVLPLLRDSEPKHLNRQQMQTLQEALAFVTEALPGDALLGQEAARINRYLQSLPSGGPEVVLTVEGE
jgi:hypothetical protein